MPGLGVDADVALLACGLSLLAGLLAGMSGFGAGLVLSAYLTPILGVKMVIPVLAVAMLVTNLGRFWAYRQDFVARTAAVVMSGAIPATVLGAWVFAIVSPRALELLLGIFLVAIVPLRRWLERHRLHIGTGGLFAGSLVFGIATGTTTGAGVLLISLLLGAGLSGPSVLATDAAVSIGTALAKSVAFGRFALLDAGTLTFGVMLGACTIPGSFAAAWIVRRTSITLHMAVLEVLVIAGGLHIAWRALFPASPA